MERLKIISIFFITILCVVFTQCIFAETVATGEQISIIYDKNSASYPEEGSANQNRYLYQKRKNFYGAIDSNENDGILLKIYDEQIDGKEAYCLNPGLSNRATYSEASSNNFNDTQKKMYAIIYNCDFTGIQIKEGEKTTYTIDNKDNYIMKQLLFWACDENNYYDIVSVFNNKVYIRYCGDMPLIVVDILEAILYRKRTDIGISSAFANLSGWTHKSTAPGNGESPNIYHGNDGFFLKQLIERINTSKKEVNKIITEPTKGLGSITITKYMPNQAGCQEFVGIHVPPIGGGSEGGGDETPVNDKYQVRVYLNHVYHEEYSTDWNYFNEDINNITYSDYFNSSDYNYNGYNLYYSDNPSVVSEPQKGGNSVSIGYNNNSVEDSYVIVFYYTEKEYSLKFVYKAQYTDGTLLEDPEYLPEEKKKKGDKVSIPKKYPNNKYNIDLFNTVSSDPNDLISHNTDTYFYMPGQETTITIIYQIGRLTVHYQKLDVRNSPESDVRYPDTYPLANDITVTNYKFINDFFCYKYKYEKEGYATGSEKKVGHGQSDKTITFYYGHRYYQSYYLKYVNAKPSPIYTVFAQDEEKNFNETGTKEVERIQYKEDSIYLTEESGNANVYRQYDYMKAKTITSNQVLNEKSGLINPSEDIKTAGLPSIGKIRELAGNDQLNKLDYSVIGFYYEYIPSTKVIVRHIVHTKDEKGQDQYNANIIKANEGATYAANYTKGSKLEVVKNGFSQRKKHASDSSILTMAERNALFSGAGSEYVEFYEIHKTDVLDVDRSHTILDGNGNYYQCIGLKRKEYKNSLEEKERPAFQSIGKGYDKNPTTMNQTINQVDGYVFIDYYYEIIPYSEEPKTIKDELSIGKTAYLKFHTKSATENYKKLDSNDSVKEGIAYVPASENLKPYITTNLCKAKSLSYTLTIDPKNNPKYLATTYEVWAVDADSYYVGSVENIHQNLNGKNINVESMIGADGTKVYANNANLALADPSNIKQRIAKTYEYVNKNDSIFKQTISQSHQNITKLDGGILTRIESDHIAEDETYQNSQDYTIETSTEIKDGKYNGYRDSSGSMQYKVYAISSASGSEIKSKSNPSKCYIYNEPGENIETGHAMPVNIYTPMQFSKDQIEVDNQNYVDHTKDGTETFVIQQGTTFNLTVSTNDLALDSPYNAVKDTGKYVGKWHVRFNFDVIWKGQPYLAGNALTINASNQPYAKTTFFGIQAIGNIENTTSTIVTEQLKVYASSVNLPNGYGIHARMKADNIAINSDYRKTGENIRIEKEKISIRPKQDTNSNYHEDKNSTSSYTATGMQGSAFYIASVPKESKSIGRIFDFEITDCLDVNFKDVFRKLNEENTVNSSTGTRYYAGTRSLLMIDEATTSQINVLNDRDNIRYGSTVSILPLGPYKHTSNSYISGVKLGYRFSFDVKTSGRYTPGGDSKRTVTIKPSYYYISKDGETYKDNIVLYYKNANGNYVKYENNQYTIYYKPKDGYRTIAASSYLIDVLHNQDTLTDKLIGIPISNQGGFQLSNQYSMTSSANQFIQVWYGEYKLPNTTIALDNSEKVDINKPLADGYIGVKFDITCTDKYKEKSITISYKENNKRELRNYNTSQWDYEGYLEFPRSNLGNELQNSIKIPLEKGTWNIDDATYQKIKGTVILYDTDNKASDDYN